MEAEDVLVSEGHVVLQPAGTASLYSELFDEVGSMFPVSLYVTEKPGITWNMTSSFSVLGIKSKVARRRIYIQSGSQCSDAASGKQ